MQNKKQTESGFSVVELIIVVTVVGVLSVMAVMSLRTPKVFEADTQAILISDIFQEARQRSLSQRTTMRVEINNTAQQIRLINEGRNPLVSTDDQIIRTVNYMRNGVFIGTTATNQSGGPTEFSPTPPITFTNSVHPSSMGNSVATLRFLRNGTVTNAGNDAIGTGSVPTGATIFVWSKYPNDASANPTTGQIFRAVTVLSSSGLTNLWKCPAPNGTCLNWTK